jgi:cell division protease FtsH
VRKTFLGGEQANIFRAKYSEKTAQEIDIAVKSVIDRAFARSQQILQDNFEILSHGANKLLEKETLDEVAIEEISKQIRLKC